MQAFTSMRKRLLQPRWLQNADPVTFEQAKHFQFKSTSHPAGVINLGGHWDRHKARLLLQVLQEQPGCLLGDIRGSGLSSVDRRFVNPKS